jgi:hypothetical protein
VTHTPERRRHPRFGAQNRLAGYLPDQDLPVSVRDIGLGGFSIETVAPLEAGIEHRVRFISKDDWSAELPARVANSRPSCRDDGSPIFVAGFAFSEDGNADTRRTIETLIEKVVSVSLYGADA